MKSCDSPKRKPMKLWAGKVTDGHRYLLTLKFTNMSDMQVGCDPKALPVHKDPLDNVRVRIGPESAEATGWG